MDKKAFSSLRQIQQSDLRPGDILLEQDHAAVSLLGAVQGVLTHNTRGGTGHTYHAAIVSHVDRGTPGASIPYVCEAHPPKADMKNLIGYNQRALVYRITSPASEQYGVEAGDVARCLANAGTPIKYVKAQLALSIFVPKFYGRAAKERIEKYKRRYAATREGPRQAICSEFVVLCYQIAMPYDEPCFPQIDARHVVPKTLEGYLNAAEGWSCVGRFLG